MCMLEVPPDYAGLHSDLIDGGLVIKDGFVLPPERPGLGITLTDEIKSRYPFVPGSGEFNSVPGKILGPFSPARLPAKHFLKILIDVLVHDEVLAALQCSGRHEIDCLDTAQRHRARGRSGPASRMQRCFSAARRRRTLRTWRR